MTLSSFAGTAMLVLAFSACPADAGPPGAARPRKIILDTDPGIDDAMAIVFALRSLTDDQEPAPGARVTPAVNAEFEKKRTPPEARTLN